MRVAAAQARPVWLDAEATTNRVLNTIEDAASQGVELVAFPEAFLPGYPFWVMLGGATLFNDPRQKLAYSAYLEAAVELNGPEVARICEAVSDLGVAVYLGSAERCGHSVYATLLALAPGRGVLSAHRKLVPTYGERLVWAPGDGAGLQVHDLGVRVGGLNCWENWMPQARFALYAQDEELHVAAFPGSAFATADLARLVALEGRVWVLVASGLLDAPDVPGDFPFAELLADKPAGFYNGGSCIAAPDGAWAEEPVAGEERLVIADIDRETVQAARQTFDPVGHYSRPDVFEFRVNRHRPERASFEGP